MGFYNVRKDDPDKSVQVRQDVADSLHSDSSETFALGIIHGL